MALVKRLMLGLGSRGPREMNISASRRQLLDLRVARERVGVLGFQVLVGLLLPFLVHRNWSIWSHRSDGSKQTDTGNQTSHSTPEDLALLTRSVQRFSWSPLTERNVVSGLLLAGSQLLPRQLHSSFQLVDQSSLILLWQFLPSRLQMVNVCIRQWSWRCLSNSRVVTNGSGDGLAKHFHLFFFFGF
ncbi:hypothetical protein METSCH_C07420 [Metschnikowia aff. pulcherrima]|uniref:Uncharacterized protein n=1 Tax=Metschnikowia aff. pulcherrima TaxID=2163413 RepID=A0A4P6XS49_9ASCO|nr:hypothetical protein METSCH_C07420 [Metschnikowia aff. pulcherrima]